MRLTITPYAQRVGLAALDARDAALLATPGPQPATCSTIKSEPVGKPREAAAGSPIKVTKSIVPPVHAVDSALDDLETALGGLDVA